MSFENKVVIVTGAGSGIGEAIAIHFANLSANLSLIDKNIERLEKIALKCEELGNGKAIRIVTDMTIDVEVKEAVDRTVEEFGKIDAVINCAGILKIGSILESGFVNDFDNVINVNLRSYVTMTHYVAPILIENKGCIVNISSVCSKVVDKKCISYNTSKAAVAHFTKIVALELAEKGVRVNAISPGFISGTKLLTDNVYDEEVISRIKVKTPPLEHVIQLEEIANIAGYLASDNAKSITGADFVVDSGYSLLGSLLDEV